MDLKTLKDKIKETDETVKRLRTEAVEMSGFLFALHRQYIEETVRAAQILYANVGPFDATMRDDFAVVDILIGEDASDVALRYEGHPVRVERVCDDYILIEGSPYVFPAAYLDGGSICL